MSTSHTEFSFAFQPIVALQTGEVVAYEALARAPGQDSAAQILSVLAQQEAYAMDAILQQRALRLALDLGIDVALHLNLLPHNLARNEESFHATLDVARDLGYALDRIAMEVVETEIITDMSRFIAAVNQLRAAGVSLSIDDFGAGFAGLNLLTRFQPDTVKLDMSIVRDIDSSGPRQAIVAGVMQTCIDLGIDIIAEGIETAAEYRWCRKAGIARGQGYYIARPGYERLPAPAGKIG